MDTTPLPLERSGLVITRKSGAVEHPVFVRRADGSAETLVHLSVLPSGHATVVDYDEHPGYENPHESPEAHAATVARFLELGGADMLGHPNAPETAAAEVERLKAKHGIAQTT